MAKAPWFPFYVDAWRSSLSVRTMTAEQCGYYIWLMVEQWADPDCRLPNDMEKLAVLAHAKSTKHFEATCGPVLEKFPGLKGGHYRANKRLSSEAQVTREFFEQKRAAGLQSAKKRWGKDLARNAPITHPQRTYNGKMQHIHIQSQSHSEEALESYKDPKVEKPARKNRARAPSPRDIEAKQKRLSDEMAAKAEAVVGSGPGDPEAADLRRQIGFLAEKMDMRHRPLSAEEQERRRQELNQQKNKILKRSEL